MSDIEIKDLKDGKELSNEAMAKLSGGYTFYSKSTLFDKTSVAKTSWSWSLSSIKLF